MDSEEQFVIWVRSYTERLVRIAYTYVKNQATAEDRVQDGLVKAYRSMHQLNNVDNPFPWLVRIVINECRTAQRRSWREVVTPILPDGCDSSSEEAYMRKLEFREVQNAVLSLPEKYRLPIVLYHFEELHVPQIAEILDMKPDTVKTYLFRGRQRLRTILKEENHGVGRRVNGCETSLL